MGTEVVRVGHTSPTPTEIEVPTRVPGPNRLTSKGRRTDGTTHDLRSFDLQDDVNDFFTSRGRGPTPGSVSPQTDLEDHLQKQ